jgi:hypothetical protein
MTHASPGPRPTAVSRTGSATAEHGAAIRTGAWTPTSRSRPPSTSRAPTRRERRRARGSPPTNPVEPCPSSFGHVQFGCSTFCLPTMFHMAYSCPVAAHHRAALVRAALVNPVRNLGCCVAP